MTVAALAIVADLYLCRDTEVAEGTARGFALHGQRRKVIVLRRDGRLHGWLDACPHYAGGTPMAWKSDAYLNGAGTHLACHSHGALFEMETGTCVLGPCLGQRLTRVDLRVSAAGEVFAVLRGGEMAWHA